MTPPTAADRRRSRRWRPQFVVWTAGVIVLGLAFVMLDSGGVDLPSLVTDRSAALDFRPWVGFVATLGLLLMAATATTFLLTGAVLFRAGGDRRRCWWLSVTGCLTLTLALDDAFRGHDIVAPHFGIPEHVVYACYSVAALAWLVGFWVEIRGTDILLMGLAALGFGSSLVLDMFEDLGERSGAGALEEFTQLVGIATLLVYAVRAALQSVAGVEPETG